MTEHQNRACRLVQLSHFKIIKFFNDHTYLFAYYALDIQASLSSSMIIKRDPFFFLSFCWTITPISGIIHKSFQCYRKLKKTAGNKEQIKKINPNNHENFKNANSKSKVELAPKMCIIIFITIGALCQSSWIFQCNGFREWL